MFPNQPLAPPGGETRGGVYIAFGLGVTAIITFTILYIIHLIKKTRRGFDPLPRCPPLEKPITCETVGMVAQPRCPDAYKCGLDGRYIGERGCYSKDGDSAPIKPAVSNNVQGLSGAWISAHNRRRLAFNTASGKPIEGVEWSTDLAEKAKAYVEHIIKTGKSSFISGTNREKLLTGGSCGLQGCGSNVFVAKSESATPEKALQEWYGKECSKYNGSFAHDTSNYTQAVWKDTKKIGCYAKDVTPLFVNGEEYSDGGVAVCVYDKPNSGNFLDNVPNPSSCVKVIGTLSGVGSEGLARSYRADASSAAIRSGGDGIVYAA